jgi:hypothetical protein
MPLLFALTLLTSATLLFLVQPMFAKMVLPLLGGTPAVWNTCMVFYQAALLGGYVYAHWSIRLLGSRRQAALHLTLACLPWLVLPIGVAAGWSPPSEGNPSVWLLALLSLSVGLPFLVVSASAPMVQAWLADTGHPAGKDPYFLYAASNAGSMLGLLGYPVLVEPTLSLARQSQAWTAGYGLLMALLAACAVALWRSPKPAAQTAPDEFEAEPPADGAPSWGRRLRWLLLALVPSSLLLGVTTHIATDIASVPLLWVVPLALYLLTFIFVFARRQLLPHRWMLRVQPFFVLPLAAWFCLNVSGTNWLMIPLHLLTFFVVAMVCHGELAATRPDPRHLTEFYLWMSVGGVLGGIFNAIVAPLVFPAVIEYPLVLVASCLLRPAMGPELRRLRAWLLDLLLPAVLAAALVAVIQGGGALLGREIKLWEGGALLALGAVAALSFIGRPLRFALAAGALMLTGTLLVNQSNWSPWGLLRDSGVVHGERSFFGVIRVRHDGFCNTNTMIHGTTRHGMQNLTAKLRREPLTYYYRTGPIGQVIQSMNDARRLNRMAVIGLGTGSIAAYGLPGQEITYYEIDPAVERIANDTQWFTYLADCRAKLRVVLGDARLSLATAPPHGYDLIVLDAFSSDSIPIHLLTREALHLYLDKLADGGIVAMHISNRYLRLEPIVGRLAESSGLACLAQLDNEVSGKERNIGKERSHWTILARREADLAKLAGDKRWRRPTVAPYVPLWTDDFSNILGVINWK